MLRYSLGLSASFFIMLGLPALAQVTPDGTVGTAVNGVVAPGNDITAPYTITGGTQRLTTLFHSFTEFSPGAANVTFDVSGNPTATAVVGRITGDNASFINGQLALTGGNTIVPTYF